MTLDAVTLTQMRYSIALLEFKSFSAAAKASHVTQSTLSLQIQKTEDLLGQALFDRNKKPIEPTPIGEKVIAIFQDIINATDNIPYVIGQKLKHLVGSFKLAVIPTLAPYIIPSVAKNLSASKHNFKLQIVDLETSRLLEKLKNGEIDAGILADAPQFNWVNSRLLFEEEFLVYFHSGHRLLEKNSLVPNDLDASEAWILGEGHCFGTQSLGLCAGKNTDFQERKIINYQGGSFETLIRVVDASSGFTLLPWLFCHRQDLLSSAQIRRFSAPRPVRQVYYISRKDTVKTAAHETLADFVVNDLPDLFAKPVAPSSKKSGENSSFAVKFF